MSELNLAQTGQFEVNAKGPTVADAVDASLGNMKVGETRVGAVTALGYGMKGGSTPNMGRISENIDELETEAMDFFHMFADDTVKIGFAAGAQPGTHNTATVNVGGVTEFTCTWSVDHFAGAATGVDAILSGLVGSTIDFMVVLSTV